MKRIIFLGLFLLSIMFTPSCEKEESIVQDSFPTALNKDLNATLLANVQPAKGFDVKFWEVNDELIVIESNYPQDASGELVDLIEGGVKNFSTLDFYKKLAGSSANSLSLKKIETTERKVNKIIADFKMRIDRGEVTMTDPVVSEETDTRDALQNGRVAACTTDPTSQAELATCPNRTGQYASSRCKTNVSSFSSEQQFSKNFILRVKNATNGTGVTASAAYCTRSVCSACPLLPTCVVTSIVGKTINPGDPVFQVTFQGTAKAIVVANGIGNCKLFHIGTGVDKI